MTAMLDTPRDAPGAELALEFWQRVTASQLSPRRGQHQEFATLIPAAGDAFLRVQGTGGDAPDCHLDLHVDDVPTASDQAVACGAQLMADNTEFVTLRSPGGLPFCLVEHRGEERRPPPVNWQAHRGGEQVSSLVDQLCIDVPAEAFEPEVTWWSHLLGWVQRPSSSPEFAVLERLAGQPLRLLLQRLASTEPMRLATAHLDLACTGRAAEVRRHIRLGARHLRRTDRWDTLLDPADRPYCITDRSPSTGNLPS
jgi:hypothetical protein